MIRQEIIDQLEYNSQTGAFVWKVNKKGHVKCGDNAGSIHTRGYVTIVLNGKCYLAHRLALIISGVDLKQIDQVDHINGNRSDNRLSNLRIANHAQNCQNSKLRKDNQSGIKGVSYRKDRNKWRARIRKDGKQILIGEFKTAEQAQVAYCEAAKKYFGEFARI